MKHILVAGIGNIFFGDDGFGVEVAKELLGRELPEEVQVTDFGIRSYDLAYAMMDGYETTVMIDTTQREKPPGTLTLLKPDLSDLDSSNGAVVNAHSMNPIRVLQLVKSLGGEARRLYLVGCEPARLQSTNGHLGLSEPVQAAVPKAADMIEELVQDLLQERQPDGLATSTND